ncbi:MAG: OmpA family protein [Bacteroidaceae bacterium]|nr:OmpA family protein [Bacteroidaceae bacterium]
MNHIKKTCLLLTALCLTAMGVNAQTNEEETVTYPQLFFGAQGGTQVTFCNYNHWELFTPTASFSFGSFFTPVVGARLNVNGAWNKGGYIDDEEDFKYKYKYLTTDVDLMVNLVNLFGKKSYYPVNVYLIGGAGFNYSWDNDEAYAHKDKLVLASDGGRFSHNARIGAQVACDISKHVSINLELTANTLKDRFNSKYHNKGDWQLVGGLGVTYKFAAKKAKKEKETAPIAAPIEPEEVWETRLDTVWYDDIVETSKVDNGSKTWTVFYDISKSDFAADEQLAGIGAFLKDFRDCKVDIKSYADAKTGNHKINQELSKRRMEKAVKALTDAGVPASSITSSYYGDTIQPFAENDKNRVTIIVANGLKDGKDKKTVRKFKTKEVRYRVK